MFDPDSQEDRLLFLLNSFAGAVNGGPWTAQTSQRFYMDEFGNAIRAGTAYFLREHAGRAVRRLALPSALRLWDLLIADNDRGEDMRQSMLDAQHQIARSDAEAEADSYEDLP